MTKELLVESVAYNKVAQVPVLPVCPLGAFIAEKNSPLWMMKGTV